VTKVYEFRDRKIKQHIGGIYDFLRKKELADNPVQSPKTRIVTDQTEGSASQQTTAKQKYIERKESSKNLKRVERKVQECEARIEKLETAIAGMDAILQNPVSPPDNEFFARYREMKETLSAEMKVWEDAHNELGLLMSEDK
jgi:ATP-binding cassette, subfamily F, member 3